MVPKVISVKTRGTVNKQWLLRHWYYIGVLAVSWIQILLFPSEPRYIVSPVLLGIIAGIYTSFKMALPLRWYDSRVVNLILFIFDLGVCASLVVLSGGLHGPFILYSLGPVITAAILFGRVYTSIAAILTFIYVVAAFFIRPDNLDIFEKFNDFGMFFLALSLAAILPYLMNVRDRQRIKVKAMLVERRHLAREIHDGLCQTIYGLRWQIQMLRNGISEIDSTDANRKIDKLIDDAETDARDLINSLRSFKTGGSLVSALKSQLAKFEEESGIGFILKQNINEKNVDDMVKSEVLLICEEALRNAAKHSNCNQLIVEIISSDNRLLVTIADDGCGFENSELKEGRGLMVMKERAELVGGQLDISSNAGTGTRIRLEMPEKCPSELLLSSQ